MAETFNGGEERIPPLYLKNKEIKEKIEHLYSSITKEKRGAFYSEIISYAKYLQSKYPDHRKWEVFHVISFSTITPEMGELIKEDFPGEDSVEAFVNKLMSKYKI